MEKIIFGLVGGLGLFIFGMKYLSEGLQKIASLKIRRMLRALTDNKLKGIGLGAFVTSVVQSSSVTTVILIGLVNAGIISLMQSATVVIGANIGTTITAQIIAFKVSKYALPMIAIGVFMVIAVRKKRAQFWGQVLLSLGIIFLGLKTMSGVMAPLKDIPSVVDFFVALSKNPILGIMVGAGITVLVQSSSAAIGMLLALASVGLIDFRAALYVLLGDNIGTTITAWLASIGGSTSAKRLACFHSFFNIIGAIYFSILIYFGIYERFIDFITPGAITLDTVARNIANAHTFFNIINALVFLPFIGILVVLIKKFVPGESTYVNIEMKYLQDNLLDTPSVALDSARKEIAEMGKIARKVFVTSVDGFLTKNKKSVQHVQTQEDAVDNLQRDITFYLSKLSTETLTLELSSQIPVFLHTVNDIERISDHSSNIAELTERIIGDEVEFSQTAQDEINSLYSKIKIMFDNANTVIVDYDDTIVESILKLESEVNDEYKDFLNKHADRLINKKCTAESALVYVNLLNNLEKVGDHLANVAKAALRHFYYTKNNNHEPRPEVLVES
ncbi:Na/Pi cotransporter family protein [bacterium]